jgi:hypothetical protein
VQAGAVGLVIAFSMPHMTRAADYKQVKKATIEAAGSPPRKPTLPRSAMDRKQHQRRHSVTSIIVNPEADLAAPRFPDRGCRPSRAPDHACRTIARMLGVFMWWSASV